MWSSSNAWPVILATYIVWYLASDRLKYSPPDTLPAWPVWVFYAPMKFILGLFGVIQTAEFDEPLDKGIRYMICCFPHGAYAFSGAAFIGPQMRLKLHTEYTNFAAFYGVASVLFYIPIIREILLLIGAREITGAAVKKLLTGTSYSIAMIPGGIHEQICTRHYADRHYVQKKLGFIRVALQHGLHIVPMYGFGENQLFKIHTIGNRLRHYLASTFQVFLNLNSIAAC